MNIGLKLRQWTENANGAVRVDFFQNGHKVYKYILYVCNHLKIQQRLFRKKVFYLGMNGDII